MTYTITANMTHHSNEVTFAAKPSAAVREALKALHFRWHSVRRVWYGYAAPDVIRAALDAAEDGQQAPADQAGDKVKEKPQPLHGVKVGDLFVSSWGYEQTNVDFFQVVALVGARSVRVREVHPQMVSEAGIPGMSADRSYKLPEAGEMLPPVRSSIFVKDQERGDLKRLYIGADGKATRFRVADYADAHPYHGEKLYESWYY